jgi:hypothetical protein
MRLESNSSVLTTLGTFRLRNRRHAQNPVCASPLVNNFGGTIRVGIGLSPCCWPNFAKLVKSSTRFGEQGARKGRILFFCAVNTYA